MPCIYDSRWNGRHGIGRFSKELNSRLVVEDYLGQGRPMSPIDPFLIPWKLIGRGGKDWFLSPGYNAPLYGGCKFVLSIHDLNHIDRSENSGWLKKIYYKIVLKKLCKKSHAILTVSEFSRNRIADWFEVDKRKIFSVGNGVSDAFRADVAPHSPGYEYVLCVSNRRGHKNENGALQGFLNAKIPASVKFVFTGKETSDLSQFIDSIGLKDRVVFAGEVSEENLASLYRGALFLLFPSFYEGFGLPIVEAFACGTPVISSNVTSMPEIAGDAALLVDPNSVVQISQAIEKLYYSEALRNEMIGRGHRRVTLFKWDMVAQRVRDAVSAANYFSDSPLTWD